jgi:hypothetical protein
MKRLLVALCVLGMISVGLSAQSAVAQEVLQLVNQARQQQGLPALAYNAALANAAQAHSDDMARTENLSHQGSDGSEFWERAATAGYNMTTGAENVLYRFDASGKGAFEQWRASPPHNANMMDGNYREIGVAFSTSASGLVYFTMVLGSGTTSAAIPTRVPAVILPSATPIAPTNTPQPARDPLIATLVAPVPTNTLSPLQPTLSAFATPTPFATATPSLVADLRLLYDRESLILLNISGRVVSLYGLSFESDSGTMPVERWDTEFLSRPLYDFRAGDCLQVWGLEVQALPNKPDVCKSRNAWVAVNDLADFWRDTTLFRVKKDGVTLAECAISSQQNVCEVSLSGRVAATSTPFVVSQGQATGTGLQVIVSADSVTLLNLSGRNLDLSRISFESDNGLLGVSAWNSPNLSRPLTAFPSADCLQVWAVGTDMQEKPSDCRYRHAWIAVGDGKQFWRNVTSFRVRNGAELLATCNVQTPVCNVTLP